MFLWTIAVFASLTVVGLVWRWFYSVNQTARLMARLAPAILQLDVLEKLLNLLKERSHVLERHSPMTLLPEHIRRARKGIMPGGERGKPSHSGRWESHNDLLGVIEHSLMMWDKGGDERRGRYLYKFSQNIGYVIQKGSKDQIFTTMAMVVVNKKGEVVTAFPILEASTEKFTDEIIKI